MSDDAAKVKNSRRRHQDETAIAKQLKIAKSHRSSNAVYDTEPHRLAKHHAMNCGNPRCYMCGNPRRTAGSKKHQLTTQERRLFQDTEQQRDKHSNGNNQTPTD